MEKIVKPAVNYLLAIIVALLVLGIFMHPSKKSSLSYKQLENMLFILSMAATVHGVYVMRRMTRLKRKMEELEQKIHSGRAAGKFN